jgi:hypothetical protein
LPRALAFADTEALGKKTAVDRSMLGGESAALAAGHQAELLADLRHPAAG